MEKICKNCYWYKPKREHAEIINCLELFEYHEETDTCDSFCKDGEYVPTGIWAGFAEMVKAVAERIENEEE